MASGAHSFPLELAGSNLAGSKEGLGLGGRSSVGERPHRLRGLRVQRAPGAGVSCHSGHLLSVILQVWMAVTEVRQVPGTLRRCLGETTIVGITFPISLRTVIY